MSIRLMTQNTVWYMILTNSMSKIILQKLGLDQSNYVYILLVGIEKDKITLHSIAINKIRQVQQSIEQFKSSVRPAHYF